MGTGWKATVAVPGGTSRSALKTVIQGRLDAVDLAMSTWKEDSDLSRLNRARVGEVVEVDPLTLNVVALCGPLIELTGGAFDPTVGPLVRLWGFGSYDEVEAPSVEAVNSARGLVDWSAIEVLGSGLVRTRDGVELDFSAVAKGYAVDLAAAALLEAGCSSFLLEVGGEMVLRGKNAGGDPWRVGIDDPLPPAGSEANSPLNFAARRPIARLSLSGKALATSGDYRNVREIDGRVVAHAIDPRTGQPINHNLASVTVIAATCAEADALATAALVLGAEGALILLEARPGVEGYLLSRVGSGADVTLKVTRTSGMKALEMAPVATEAK
ncbi:MAG: thiamine biosynthesis lipoprotein [Paracoccaceae bacterium]|jgi:thiamine biosynthesis lipoprotein